MKLFDVPSFTKLDTAYDGHDVIFWQSLFQTVSGKTLTKEDYTIIATKLDRLRHCGDWYCWHHLFGAARTIAEAAGHVVLRDFFEVVADVQKSAGHRQSDSLRRLLSQIVRKHLYSQADYTRFRQLTRLGNVDLVLELLAECFEIDSDELVLLREIAVAHDQEADSLLRWIDEFDDLAEGLYQNVDVDLVGFLSRHRGQLESIVGEIVDVLHDADLAKRNEVVQTFLDFDYAIVTDGSEQGSYLTLIVALFYTAWKRQDALAVIKFGTIMDGWFRASYYVDWISYGEEAELSEFRLWVNRLNAICSTDAVLLSNAVFDEAIRRSVERNIITDEEALRKAVSARVRAQVSDNKVRRRL